MFLNVLEVVLVRLYINDRVVGGFRYLCFGLKVSGNYNVIYLIIWYWRNGMFVSNDVISFIFFLVVIFVEVERWLEIVVNSKWRVRVDCLFILFVIMIYYGVC